MTERTTQEQWAWEAGEDPVRTCRECGEIYSEFALDYRPDVDGCPNCYEPDPELVTLDERAAELEEMILATGGIFGEFRREWRELQNKMRAMEGSP